jgi:hypothetical protein
MKIGDLVSFKKYHHDFGQLGLVMEISQRHNGAAKVYLMESDTIKCTFKHSLKLISESINYEL